MSFELPYRAEEGFDAVYGLELTEIEDGRMVARVAVHDQLKQPHGLVHGGVFAAIAESIASLGTQLGVASRGLAATGLSNQTSFLRPITGGTIHAVAVAKHRGRTTWVWEVEMTDDQGRLCVLTRMTVAAREPVQRPPA